MQSLSSSLVRSRWVQRSPSSCKYFQCETRPLSIEEKRLTGEKSWNISDQFSHSSSIPVSETPTPLLSPWRSRHGLLERTKTGTGAQEVLPHLEHDQVRAVAPNLSGNHLRAVVGLAELLGTVRIEQFVRLRRRAVSVESSIRVCMHVAPTSSRVSNSSS